MDSMFVTNRNSSAKNQKKYFSLKLFSTSTFWFKKIEHVSNSSKIMFPVFLNKIKLKKKVNIKGM